VIFDCRVHKLANCFPMIPSGAGHHEMLLADDFAGDDIDYTVSEAGKVMV
jgi:acetolactate synthase-1/2/3 large subunit